MGTLKSKLFTEGDPDVVTKLENCANGVPSQVQSHFSTRDNRSGEHVRRVKTALKQIQAADPKLGIPAFDISDVYDENFAKAIFVYKEKRGLKNHSNQIDNVVGIKTIIALDRDIGGAAPEPDPPDIEPVGQPKADIVVRFKGSNIKAPLPPDVVLPNFLVPSFKPTTRADGTSTETVMVHSFGNRLLIRVGSLTRTVGSASEPLFLQTHEKITNLVEQNGAVIDRIYIHGSSSGGRNAVDFAAFLTKRGLKPHFLVAVDAAFTQADTPMRPEAVTNTPTRIPIFVVDPGSTPIQNCFNSYQTKGNHAKDTNFNGVIFTSSMDGEIHGEMGGFSNENLDKQIANPGLSDFDLHVLCCDIGMPQGERRIAADIRKLAF